MPNATSHSGLLIYRDWIENGCWVNPNISSDSRGRRFCINSTLSRLSQTCWVWWLMLSLIQRIDREYLSTGSAAQALRNKVNQPRRIGNAIPVYRLTNLGVSPFSDFRWMSSCAQEWQFQVILSDFIDHLAFLSRFSYVHRDFTVVVQCDWCVSDHLDCLYFWF